MFSGPVPFPSSVLEIRDTCKVTQNAKYGSKGIIIKKQHLRFYHLVDRQYEMTLEISFFHSTVLTIARVYNSTFLFLAVL